MAAGDGRTSQLLLHLLCAKVTGLRDDALTPCFKIATAILGSSIYSPGEVDEFEISDKIKRKLVKLKREKDAALFAELHRKLQSQPRLKHRGGLLCLLYQLSGEGALINTSCHGSMFYRGLSGNATSTPFVSHTPAAGQVSADSSATCHSSGLSSGGTSGFSSIQSFRSNDPSPIPQSLPPSYMITPGLPPGRQAAPSAGQRVLQLMGSSGTTQNLTRGSRLVPTSLKLAKKPHPDVPAELPEHVLLREVIYVLQGIEGKYIKYDVNKEAYRIDSKTGIPRSMRQTIAKVAELGWLFNKVRKYADSRSTDRAFGLIGQSFCAALQEEIVEYLRLMGVMEAQLQQEEDQGTDNSTEGRLTLRKLIVWTNESSVRLRAMAALVDICQGKKGGELASAIHSYIQHGDPAMQALIKHKLTLLAQPIFRTILHWQYEGLLEDTYHEFFVASDPLVKDERLWHDKYSLRKDMIPSFLSIEQAKKILLTGKSINFLRHLCHDRTAIRKLQSVRSAETRQVESIFSQDLDGVFQKMIDTVYKETSLLLLEVLHNKYKFLDHLKAMRRYLLLGQGDFIRHLMDLLQEDLAKPAQTLFLHNLNGILETAIRATNAQYDDVDILKRLDVRLLEVSPGDTGWDVFSLDYHVDGPIQTVFTPECMIIYLRVFNFLWRAKRVDYILAGIWKGQMSNARLLRSVPEVSGVLHQCQVLASEMVHFVQQVQYYINFEVLECSWHELLDKVKSAEDLDHIIAAHQEFLDTIITRSLLDSSSQKILTMLRTIFDLVIQFQLKQDHIYQAAAEELCRRQAFAEKKKQKTEEGQWGVTETEERDERRRRKSFLTKLLDPTSSQLIVLAKSYQDLVKQFLLKLTAHSDVSLRFLSFRLDFSEHYRTKRV